MEARFSNFWTVSVDPNYKWGYDIPYIALTLGHDTLGLDVAALLDGQMSKLVLRWRVPC